MPAPMPALLSLHQVHVVFAEGVPLLRFIPDVTMGDIARLWGEPSGTAGRERVDLGVLLPTDQFRALKSGNSVTDKSEIARIGPADTRGSRPS